MLNQRYVASDKNLKIIVYKRLGLAYDVSTIESDRGETQMELKIISQAVTVEVNGDQYVLSHENFLGLKYAVREYNRIQALRDNDFRLTALDNAKDVVDSILECAFHVHGDSATVRFNCGDTESVIDNVLQLVDSACVEVRRG